MTHINTHISKRDKLNIRETSTFTETYNKIKTGRESCLILKVSELTYFTWFINSLEVKNIHTPLIDRDTVSKHRRSTVYYGGTSWMVFGTKSINF